MCSLVRPCFVHEQGVVLAHRETQLNHGGTLKRLRVRVTVVAVQCSRLPLSNAPVFHFSRASASGELVEDQRPPRERVAGRALRLKPRACSRQGQHVRKHISPQASLRSNVF